MSASRGVLVGAVALVATALLLAACSDGSGRSADGGVTTPSGGPTRLTTVGYPDAATTGPRAGVVLTDSGSIVVKKDGAVVSGLRVRGSITVKADRVTIRDVVVLKEGRYAIKVAEGARGLLVEDVEIDGQGTEGAAVCCSHYTLRRVDIHDVTEGPRMGGDTTVEESWIHHLRRCPECHIDALQTTDGKGILIRRNRIEAFNPDLGDPMNAAYQFGGTSAKTGGIVVEGNWLDGGNYTVNGGGGGEKGAGALFRDNVFGRNSRFGPVGNLGPNTVFDASNVWADSGRPVEAS